MLELEPMILLLIYGVVYFLLSKIPLLANRITRVLAVLFWMTLGIYWGLFLGAMDSLAPGLAFMFGVFLIAQFQGAHKTWFLPMQQALLVQLTIGAHIIDSLAFWQRFELFIIAMVSWYLLFVAWSPLHSLDGKGRQMEGSFKSLLNIMMAFIFLLLGQILLQTFRTELLGPIYHSGFGLIGSAFYLLGWAWLIGLWPFQTWLIDEVESQMSSTLFFYFIGRAAISFWLLRMWLTNFPEVTLFHDLLLVLSLVSLGWSALLSLMQVHLQRLLAYTVQALWSLIFLWTALLAKGVVIIDWSLVAIAGFLAYAWLIYSSSAFYRKLCRVLGHDPIISDGLRASQAITRAYRAFFLALAMVWVICLLLGVSAMVSVWPLSMWAVFVSLAVILLLGFYALWQTTIVPFGRAKSLKSKAQ
ncbi:MAG: hypothetical protein ACOH5I_04705 [Oligoflexus sp.]